MTRQSGESVTGGTAGDFQVARRIVQNFGFIAIGQTLGDAFTFLLFIFLSRSFGEAGVGAYSFAIGFTGFFAVFAEFGLASLTIKGVSRHISSFQDYYGRILSLRLALSVAVLVVLVLVTPLLPFPGDSKIIILLIGGYQVFITLASGLVSVFIAREDAHFAGFVEFSLRAMTALAAIAAILAGGSLIITLATLPAVALGQLLISYGVVATRYGRPRIVASISSLTRVAHEAIPYGLSLFLTHLYTRTDVVLLGFLIGANAAGLYNVAYRVIFVLMLILQFGSRAIFPQASRLYVDSSNDFKSLYHKFLNVTVLIGLPTAAGLWLIAPKFITLIFGEDFTESASVLRILAPILLLSLVSYIMGIFLMSSDRQVERTKVLGVVACASVIGNLTLILFFGVKGAAVAALLSQLLQVALYALKLRGVVGWPKIGSRLAIGAVGVASFCVPFTLLPSLSLGVVVPASILLYLITLVMFKEIRRNEIHGALSLLKR
jgi:O-antigen/teichoic acid export membrane protein